MKLCLIYQNHVDFNIIIKQLYVLYKTALLISCM